MAVYVLICLDGMKYSKYINGIYNETLPCAPFFISCYIYRDNMEFGYLTYKFCSLALFYVNAIADRNTFELFSYYYCAVALIQGLRL